MTSVLDQERKKVSFSLEDMSIYLYETKVNRDLIIKGYNMLANDPITRNDPKEFSMSREELFQFYGQKTIRVHELLNATEGNNIVVKTHFANQILLTVHSYMFIPTIQNLGTPKQIEKWIPRANKLEITGCYAQTELGHGSDIQSLQTTATYDPETDEFILHSPTIESIKWWPGDLGVCANHAVTHAQLIIKGQNYGVQTFIVQLRDIDTHKPLPGITVGDIGPKFGYNTKDNGFLKFDQVRIPRENMLMKYAKVNKKGEFSRPANEKISYAIMMSIRLLLSGECMAFLATAQTIGVRYSLSRTQFYDENQQERKILDYQLQMDKLIPTIALSYAINASSRKLKAMYEENLERISKHEDFSLMADLHASLSGTKAFNTWDTAQALEIIRMSCGGHGYSHYSGLPSLYPEFVATCTLEGENSIMALQTARYLVKCLQNLRKGKPLAKNVEYLNFLNEILAIQSWNGRTVNDINIEALHQMARANAAFLVYEAGQKLMEATSNGLSPKEAWDTKAGLSLLEAARAHTTCFTIKAFMEYYPKANGVATCKVLEKLCELYAVIKLIQYPLGMLESGYIKPTQIKLLKQKREILLEELRPEAIGLVEAWMLPDNSLRTAIGNSDGIVYERLYDWAKNNNEFNKKEVHDIFHTCLKKLRQIDPPRPFMPKPAL